MKCTNTAETSAAADRRPFWHINPARFLNHNDSLGTVEKGKLADLVLLDADPLADINTTKKIAAIVINGRYLPTVMFQYIVTIESQNSPDALHTEENDSALPFNAYCLIGMQQFWISAK